MKSMCRLAVIVSLLMSGLLMSVTMKPAFAQDAVVLGAHGSWTSYVFKEDKGKVCYMASTPTKSEGKYTKRDPVFINVTHRPANKTSGVVSVIAGYAYKDGASVTLNVGDKAFELNAHGELAWARGEDDKAIVAAMKSGSDVVVKGRSAHGTETVDHFSLAGFTAALAAIGKACGVR